ncbi:MAG: trimethylamine methyltransferase family protein [Sedimentisphaerales bacterium]|nr:trimethylamine methyltransferase family protein [Sedimentisphaerales bacterium]
MTSANFEPTVRVRILDDDSISKIHEAALEVLEKTGIAINTEQGRKILLDAGCKAKDSNVILIPPELVERSLKTAPSSVVLYDRLGQPRCTLEGWKTSFGTGSDCPFTIDRKTNEKRQCTYDDVAKGALVCDYLENIDFVMPVGIISDRPRFIADIYAVEATMNNTVKPVVFTAHNQQNFQKSIDLAAAVAGGIEHLQEKPTVCLYDEPTSPLKHMPEATDKLIHAARMRIPVIFTPCPSMGATAPATAAGILVQASAECLSGLVIHQLAGPGAPIIFGGVLTLLDMSTTIYPYGSPELHKLCAALTDIAHFYHLPMFGTCGCSDAKRVDAQAGMEMGFSVLMSTLSGQNLIHDIGFLESALITSYEMYVLADEAIGMAKHIAKGVTVNRETLAVDVIDDIGQAGNFLMHEHTLNFFRKELYFPKILDRTNYTGWEKQGSKTLDVKLKEKVDEILATHKAKPIPADVASRADKILQKVEAQA